MCIYIHTYKVCYIVILGWELFLILILLRYDIIISSALKISLSTSITAERTKALAKVPQRTMKKQE